MISYVKGPLVAIEEDVIVVEAGHVGLAIHVPVSLLPELPGMGKEVTVYTYFHAGPFWRRESGDRLSACRNGDDVLFLPDYPGCLCSVAGRRRVTAAGRRSVQIHYIIHTSPIDF